MTIRPHNISTKLLACSAARSPLQTSRSSVNPRPLIFISAVSKELRTARQLVANTLTFIGYEPVWQDVFGTESGDLREVLRRKIDGCKGVVQIVGSCYGVEPPAPDEEFGRVSYTQYEALYARKRGKKVWYLFIDESFRTDGCEVEAAELRDLQLHYRTKLRSEAHIFHPLTSTEGLEASVLKLRDDLTRLRRGVKWWAAAVAILLLVTATSVVWLLHSQRQTGRQVGQAKEAMDTMSTEVAKLRELLSDYRHVEAEVRQEKSDPQETADSVEERVYADLAAKTGVDADLLRQKLPALAQQIKQQADTSAYDRANAAYVAKDYAQAESLALVGAQDNSKPNTEKLKALQLAAAAAAARSGYDQALSYLLQAEKLSDRTNAPREWANVQYAKADLLLRQNKFQQVEPVIRDVIAERTRALGDTHADTLEARRALIVVLLRTAKYTEARSEAEAVLPIHERMFGADDRRTLNARLKVGDAHYSLAHYDLAEAEYHRVIDAAEKKLGPGNPLTLAAHAHLGQALTHHRKLPEAEAELRHVLAIQEKGKKNYNRLATLMTRGDLAILVSREGRAAEAEVEQRAIINTVVQKFGVEHPLAINTSVNLAVTLTRERRFADAAAENGQALPRAEKVFGLQHPITLTCLHSYAEDLMRMHKVSEARGYAQRGADAAHARLGPDHPITREADALLRQLDAPPAR
jgi:tetratricopeptide (TPR) repeat protein